MRNLCTVIAVLCFVLQQPAGAGNGDLVLVDDSQGCFHHVNSATVWAVDKNIVRERDSSRTVSITDYRKLIKAILESKQKSELDLAELGITEQSLAAHRHDVRQHLREYQYGIPNEIIELNKDDLEYPKVSKSLREWLLFDRQSTTRISVHAWLRKNDVCGDDIELSSSTELQGMLPWTVKIGEISWQSYSLEIPTLLAKFADPKGPSYDLMDCQKYWSDDFWTNGRFWYETLGRELEKQTNLKIAETLPGFERAKASFAIQNCQKGLINSHPESLYVSLTRQRPNLITSIVWFNQLDRNKQPRGDWNQFLRVADRCENLARKNTWLMRWMEKSPKNKLCTNIVGNECRFDSNDSIAKYVKPYWRDAKQKGSPVAEIRLEGAEGEQGQIWLSDTREDPAIILEANEKTTSYLFGKTSGHYKGKENHSYLLVKPNGETKQQIISRKTAAILEQQFENLSRELLHDQARWNKKTKSTRNKSLKNRKS